jgi:hypothetical protein
VGALLIFAAGLGNSAIRLYDFLVFAEGESILRVMAFAFDGVVCLSIWCLFPSACNRHKPLTLDASLS